MPHPKRNGSTQPSFVMQTIPTFEQFEAWIMHINGGSLDPGRVERINAALTGTMNRGTPPATGSAEAALSEASAVRPRSSTP